MKKLALLLILLASSSNLWAWDSETGTGVVSAQASIIRTSLEATQVLQSDALSNLYGVTILGGTVNYASFNSGGVFSTRNVASSRDVVLLGNDQYLAWLRTDGLYVRVGVSADNSFVLPDKIRASGASFSTVAVSGQLRVSGNSNFINVTVSGGTTLTSTYTTGTCSFSFNNGILTSATC